MLLLLDKFCDDNDKNTIVENSCATLIAVQPKTTTPWLWGFAP